MPSIVVPLPLTGKSYEVEFTAIRNHIYTGIQRVCLSNNNETGVITYTTPRVANKIKAIQITHQFIEQSYPEIIITKIESVIESH